MPDPNVKERLQKKLQQRKEERLEKMRQRIKERNIKLEPPHPDPSHPTNIRFKKVFILNND
jgi:hypothetical protein